MARPALEPGRLLEVSSDGHRRGMTVLDKTRLTDRLSTFFLRFLSQTSQKKGNQTPFGNVEKFLVLRLYFKFKTQMLEL